MLVLSQSVFVLGTLDTQPTTDIDKVSCASRPNTVVTLTLKKGTYVSTTQISLYHYLIHLVKGFFTTSASVPPRQ
jgi:hypothetical protein